MGILKKKDVSSKITDLQKDLFVKSIPQDEDSLFYFSYYQL